MGHLSYRHTIQAKTNKRNMQYGRDKHTKTNKNALKIEKDNQRIFNNKVAHLRRVKLWYLIKYCKNRPLMSDTAEYKVILERAAKEQICIRHYDLFDRKWVYVYGSGLSGKLRLLLTNYNPFWNMTSLKRKL